MKVVTAVEDVDRSGISPYDVKVFLAGGISNCRNWQNKVIDILSHKPETERLVVFNPRRENFPIYDSNAAKEQIEWEFYSLLRADIFSVYFCNSESVQPITFYELGRNVTRMDHLYGRNACDHIVVSVENGFSRTRDVVIQTGLVIDDALKSGCIITDSTPQKHADRIYELYKKEVSKI